MKMMKYLKKKKKLDNEQIESTNKRSGVYISNRDVRQLKRERMKQVYENPANSLKICIDCSFSEIMSRKEMSRLAQQVGRCHASNKSLSSPVHLTLCNLNKESHFYKELCRMNDGFEQYIINETEQSIQNYYKESTDNIAYMSPDSENVLECLDAKTTYVIGGLVDETVSKKVTIDKCKNLSINSYSLPIDKYMSRKSLPDGEKNFRIFNYSKILAINQVFDILANYYISEDWPSALDCGVPKRKGYCLNNKNLLEDHSVISSLEKNENV